MNEKNRIWWICGGLLLLVAVVALSINGGSEPGVAGPQEASGGASTKPAAEAAGNTLDRRRERLPEKLSLTEHNAKRQKRPLSRTPNPSTEDCLEALAWSALEADRVRAAMLLGRRAAEEDLVEKAVPALITAMTTDEAPQVWLVTAQALGKYGAGAAEAVPHLLTWFDHLTMRDVAIDALGDIGPDADSAIASIAPIATDAEERLISRRKAIEALVKIGGPDDPVVAAVLEFAEVDPDVRIGLAARQALKIGAAAEAKSGSVAPGGAPVN